MKKAKIMLTALVVFAAVGSTLAFKAVQADKIYVDTDGDGFSDASVSFQKLVASGTQGAIATDATNTLNVATVNTFYITTSN